jgi:hypothetical protein
MTLTGSAGLAALAGSEGRMCVGKTLFAQVMDFLP